MRRLRPWVAALGLAAWCAQATAEIVPRPGQADPRVRIVSYDATDVVKLQGYIGYQIHIEWAAGEELVNVGAGDVSGLEIGAHGNHFFIKPKHERISTNLTVLTSRRAYHFDYSVLKPPAGHSIDTGMIYSIRFLYPQEEAERTAGDAQRRQTEERMSRTNESRPHNADYWYCGAPSLKPVTAHDDGIHTRLRFAARGEFPALFVRNDDGTESLLNFSVENDEVVIHRIARRLVLRRGQLVGCVVNQAFEAAGERTRTNTSTPHVQRQTRGAHP